MTVLRPVAPELWVAEGPLRRLGMELDELGPVRFVVPASKFHGHLFMEQYRQAYPRPALPPQSGLRAETSRL